MFHFQPGRQFAFPAPRGGPFGSLDDSFCMEIFIFSIGTIVKTEISPTLESFQINIAIVEVPFVNSFVLLSEFSAAVGIIMARECHNPA
jgi:hypothetical protein